MQQNCGSLSGNSLKARGAPWILGFAGLFLFVFSVAALSGPGRIDIVDGQTRYEVARSLVDHGDGKIRDPRVWFGVFPGRKGQLYTKYRFPQTAAGVAAIWASDTTGPVSEGRRHFFFVLTSAVACAVLALAYAAVFRHIGHQPLKAVVWAVAGIFCTPSWFYGTSTFDDILGTTAIVWAVTIAFLARYQRPMVGAAIAGLMLGVAFNCKQPLGAFVFAVLGAILDRNQSLHRQWARIALVLAGLAMGILAYKSYDLYKFPPSSTTDHTRLLAQYMPVFPGKPLAALLCLSISPGAGVLWYCPPVVLALIGVRFWRKRERRFCDAALASSATFVLFLSMLTIFKGDPAWGPRYLTPMLALWWLFVPAGAGLLRPRFVRIVLGLGIVVQLAGLSVDPHRLYVERGLPSVFGAIRPYLYFHPANSHVLNRPREVFDICFGDEQHAQAFTPSSTPTFAMPIIDDVPGGPHAVHAYTVLDSFRPWWISQLHLPSAKRPVDIQRTVVLLALSTVAGLLCLTVSIACLRRFDKDCDRNASMMDIEVRPWNDATQAATYDLGNLSSLGCGGGSR
jgi:hypothetical protein